MNTVAALGSSPTALLACARTLADLGLYAEAATFGTAALTAAHHARRSGSPYAVRRTDRTDDVVVGRYLLRADRPDEALRLLDGPPDDAHPELDMLRCAARVLRNGSAQELLTLVRLVGEGGNTAMGLQMLAVAAHAVGEHRLAAEAARLCLAGADLANAGPANAGPANAGSARTGSARTGVDDPDLLVLVAIDAALRGDPEGAVRAAEQAALATLPIQPDPAEEIADALDAATPNALLSSLPRPPRPAVQFLTQGCLAARRPVYGRLLTARLPAGVVLRERLTVRAVLGSIVGSFVLWASNIGLLIAVGFLVFVGGFVHAFGPVVRPYPGLTRTHSRRIHRALGLYRQQVDLPDTGSLLTAPTAGVIAVLIVLGLWHTDTLGGRYLQVLVMALAAAGAMTAVYLLVRTLRQRRTAAHTTTGPTDVAPDRCRCWTADWIAGPSWRRYLREHLDEIAVDVVTAGTAVRRCPQTEKSWLHLAESDIAVTLLPHPTSDRTGQLQIVT